MIKSDDTFLTDKLQGFSAQTSS